MPPADVPPATPELRAAYDRECAARWRQASRVSCLLAILLVPAFLLLDAIAVPAWLRVYFVVRMSAMAVLAGILWLLARPFGARHGLALSVGVALILGFMIDAMTIPTGGAASPYSAGPNLIIVAIAVVMQWRPLCSALVCLALTAGYVLCTTVFVPLTDVGALVTNLLFIGTTALIAVAGAALGERLRWREFSTRHALEEALRHKDEFMAKMTHELRTPLHVMIGYSDILLEDGFGEPTEARVLVEGIRRKGVQLHALVSDLLDYAKIAAGKMEVRAEPLDVAQVVAQLAQEFRPLAERKGLRLEVRCDDVPALVGDAGKLQQVLYNLIGNALKFTDEGVIALEARGVAGGGARAALPGFTFLAEPTDVAPSAGVVLFVRDTGMGMREEDLRRLAADFQQLDGQAAACHGGTGLGLSISKRLAEVLGGSVAVQSRLGQGSTFAVFLPATIDPARGAGSGITASVRIGARPAA
jgi:signal transduction histidine kinase